MKTKIWVAVCILCVVLLLGGYFIYFAVMPKWFSQSMDNVELVTVYYHSTSTGEVRFYPNKDEIREIQRMILKDKKLSKNVCVNYSDTYVTIQFLYQDGRRDDFYYSLQSRQLVKEIYKNRGLVSYSYQIGNINTELADYLRAFFVDRDPRMQNVLAEE